MRASGRVRLFVLALLLMGAKATRLHAEDGYDLWLRCHLVSNSARLGEYQATISRVSLGSNSATVAAIRFELQRALSGLLGRNVIFTHSIAENTLVLGTPASSRYIAQLEPKELKSLGDEGFLIANASIDGHRVIRR